MYFLKAQVLYIHCYGPQVQGNYCLLPETDLHSLFPMAETVWYRYVTAWVPGAAYLGIENVYTQNEEHVCLIAACIPGQ